MNSTSRHVLAGMTFALAGGLLLGASAMAQNATLAPGVVAEQNGAQVTLQDIDAYAAKIPEKDRAGFFDSPKRIESTIMGLLLKKLHVQVKGQRPADSNWRRKRARKNSTRMPGSSAKSSWPRKTRWPARKSTTSRLRSSCRISTSWRASTTSRTRATTSPPAWCR